MIKLGFKQSGSVCWWLALVLVASVIVPIAPKGAAKAAPVDQIYLGDALEQSLPNVAGEEGKGLSDQDLVDIKSRIKSLEQRLAESRQSLAASEEKLQVSYAKLSDIRDQKLTLANQLQSFNDEIIFTERQLAMVGEHVQARQLEIGQLDKNIITHNQQLDQQKSVLSQVIRELYDQDRQPPLLALLGKHGFAEHINQRGYLAKVEKVGEQQYQGIKQLRNELVAERVGLSQMRSSLRELTDHLQERRENLALQQESKLKLLSQTQEQEDLYRKLLEEGRQQEAKIDADVSALRLDLKAMLDKGADRLQHDPDVLAFLQTPGSRGLIWPVLPLHGLSAHFLDQDYRRVFGIPHHAIDIRIAQGAAVKAAAGAYVLKARDNGYGYSYIVLAHGSNMTTVYGHITQIMVKEGQTVRQGEVIGFSGGMPGSRGAGWLTTGPHLHFEVRIGGQPQNPVPYLPGIETLNELKEQKLSDRL